MGISRIAFILGAVTTAGSALALRQICAPALAGGAAAPASLAAWEARLHTGMLATAKTEAAGWVGNPFGAEYIQRATEFAAAPPPRVRCGQYGDNMSYLGYTCSATHVQVERYFPHDEMRAYELSPPLEEMGTTVFASGWGAAWWQDGPLWICPDHREFLFEQFLSDADVEPARDQYATMRCADCGGWYSFNHYDGPVLAGRCDVCVLLAWVPPFLVGEDNEARRAYYAAFVAEFRAWLKSRPDPSAELAALQGRWDSIRATHEAHRLATGVHPFWGCPSCYNSHDEGERVSQRIRRLTEIQKIRGCGDRLPPSALFCAPGRLAPGRRAYGPEEDSNK